MTRWWSVCILFAAVPALGQSAETAEPAQSTAQPTIEEKSVAVLEFRAEGLEEAVAKNLNELFTSEAGNIPGYKVIGHSEIKDMVGFEVEKQTLGCSDASCFSQIGGALGVDFIVSGSVGKVGDTFVINVKLIDITKTETKNRVGDTIAGRIELLTDKIRIAAWQLFTDGVPADLTAAFAATKARLEAEDAMMRAKQAKAGPRRVAPPAPVATPPPTPSTWQGISKKISVVVASVGLIGGAVMHGISFYIASEDVGDGQQAQYDGPLIFNSQADAQLAADLRTYAIVSYVVGGVGVIAATVFGILEPTNPEPTAVRVAPTGNGFVVVF